MTEIRWTSKQIEILNLVKEGNSDGSDRSVYDIMDNLSYEVKRDALLHSLKILVDNGYIERRDREVRDGKTVRVIKVTTKANEIV
jgi:Fe2+ or Zn2+ uptake regulation protein